MQKTRLYLQGRPLLSHWLNQRKGRLSRHDPHVQLIDRELTQDFVAIDCAGWLFANQHRTCTAIEIDQLSAKLWTNTHFEYDYLTWHPTYLAASIVLAYHSSYFKYCELEDFLTFCKIWSAYHPKLIIGLDPTKVKFNYFKFDLTQLVQGKVGHCNVRILDRQDFSLLFVLESK